MPNAQEVTQQATNETQPAQETQPASVPSVQVEAEQSGQTVPQEPKPQEPKPQESPRKNHNDRIAELESKIAKMEAIYQLQGQNVVDMEVCTDLLLKGYTLDQLKQSKPYLFGQTSQPNQGVVRQPPKVVAETQAPKSPIQSSVSSDGFVKTLANMLISKF